MLCLLQIFHRVVYQNFALESGFFPMNINPAALFLLSGDSLWIITGGRGMKHTSICLLVMHFHSFEYIVSWSIKIYFFSISSNKVCTFKSVKHHVINIVNGLFYRYRVLSLHVFEKNISKWVIFGAFSNSPAIIVFQDLCRALTKERSWKVNRGEYVNYKC